MRRNSIIGDGQYTVYTYVYESSVLRREEWPATIVCERGRKIDWRGARAVGERHKALGARPETERQTPTDRPTGRANEGWIGG